MSLAQYSALYSRSWAVDSINGRVRLRAQLDRAHQEIGLLREAMRIKDARMARIAPLRRPHFPPTERMANLELRAARGWSLQQTADAFQLTAPTIASWLQHADEAGSAALVQMRVPVNKFPDSSAILSSGSRCCVRPWARSSSPKRLPVQDCTSVRRRLAGCSKTNRH